MSDPIFAMIVPMSGGGGRPDQGLPPEHGGRPSHPWLPGHPLPDYPSNGLPEGGVIGGDRPGNELPVPPMPPSTKPPPPTIWPGVPIHPETPNNELPQVPGTIWPPLPGGVNGKALVLVWVVCVGWRWVVIDTNAEAGNELPEEPMPEPK